MSQTSIKTPSDFTEGSIIGSILKMGLPSMFGFLTQNIYNLVDTWWVSRLPEGESAVAALTFFGVILMLLFSFNQLVGPGSVAVISRRYGEKNFALAEKAIKETVILKLLFGFGFGIVGFFAAEDLLSLVGAEGTALRFGIEYSQIMFLSLGVPYAAFSVFTALRSIANPHTAMYLMVGSNLLNMALDPLFIFGYFGFPTLGIRGAAVASVISFSLTLMLGLILLYSGRMNIKLHLEGKERLGLQTMWTLIRIGLPAWLGSVSFSGARLLIAPLVATFGTSVVAAYGVGMQVVGFGVMMIVGIGLGLSSLIGHNVGGEKTDRARKTGNQSIGLSCLIMLTFGLVVFVFADNIMGLFFQAPETLATGSSLLRIFAFCFPFLGLFIMVEEIHMGVGLNTPIMVFQIIHSWLLQVVPIMIIIHVLDLSEIAVWWTITGSVMVSSLAVYTYYLQGRWLTAKI
jgi:putative MATE family efflux protein